MSTHSDIQEQWRARSIATEHLNVRAFRPEDGDDLYAYLSRPEVYRFEPGEPLDHQQAGKRAQDFSNSPDFWAVELRAEGKVIGQVYFSQVEPQHQMTWELGYILSPDYQRQGYASEAAAALVQAGFAAAGIHRVVAHCNPENLASWKLLEKIGFRREGLMQKNNYFRKNTDGEPIWTDTYIYARLAED
jgi:RimJ/RimL family protein N-acetyltransferase